MPAASKAQSIAGIIAFGMVMTFSSGLGQTFFISLFNQNLRDTFQLSHGQIGSLYFVGTLSSAVIIIWAGKLLDVISVKVYTFFVCAGLAGACLIMSTVSGPVTLAIAFFLLRFFGQGLSGHTGITTASRSPPQVRGRVISVSGLGFSLSEITLPLVTVWLLTTWHWRDVWQAYAMIELIVIIGISQWLLWQFPISGQQGTVENSANANGSWNRAQMMRDNRFWLIAPALFAPSIISTGLFFHQQSLAESKGFSITVWASAISVYSIAAVTVSLIAGQAVDRWSGSTVAKALLLPFIAALMVAISIESEWLPFIYYGLMGMTFGIATPAVSALWVELYGSANIASIRSLVHAIMVFGSALGPVIFGTLLDNGYSWNFILVLCALWMSVASVLLFITPLHKQHS